MHHACTTHIKQFQSFTHKLTGLISTWADLITLPSPARRYMNICLQPSRRGASTRRRAAGWPDRLHHPQPERDAGTHPAFRRCSHATHRRPTAMLACTPMESSTHNSLSPMAADHKLARPTGDGARTTARPFVVEPAWLHDGARARARRSAWRSLARCGRARAHPSRWRRLRSGLSSPSWRRGPATKLQCGCTRSASCCSRIL